MNCFPCEKLNRMGKRERSPNSVVDHVWIASNVTLLCLSNCLQLTNDVCVRSVCAIVKNKTLVKFLFLSNQKRVKPRNRLQSCFLSVLHCFIKYF